MKVGDFGELRNRLAPAGAEMHVVKNNFLKRAMADSGYPDAADKLIGQTAVVTGKTDVAPVAKILKTFAAEFKIATLKIGFVDRAMLSTSEVETLANLPSREVLLAQLLGLLLSPATKLVRLLNEPASAFARLLNAKASSMPAEPVAPAPVAEEKKEEPMAQAPEAAPQPEATPQPEAPSQPEATQQAEAASQPEATKE